VPADVPAGPDRAAVAAQPGHRLADGHVQRPGRRARRLPPGAPGQQGAGRGRPGHDRDGVRLRGGPDQPRLRGPLHAAAGGGLAADRVVRARARRGQDRRPARPFRPEGLHPADVGGHGRAAAGGELGGVRAVPAPLLPRQPAAAGADGRRAGGDHRAVRGRGGGGRAGRIRPAGTALRRSCPRSPTSAPTGTAGRWLAGCATRWRCSTRSARPGRPGGR
jgi:hypothetical protein